ncbi:MAG: hypothetical protein R2845_10685 [Thermomicrobiales bacterium]
MSFIFVLLAVFLLELRWSSPFTCKPGAINPGRSMPSWCWVLRNMTDVRVRLPQRGSKRRSERGTRV